MKSKDLIQGDVYQYIDEDLDILCIYDKYQMLFQSDIWPSDIWPYEFKIISCNDKNFKQDILYLGEEGLIKLKKLS